MKFLLTSELGRLAKWLRILGFDTVYMKEQNPATLILKALREERIILTRNHHLPLGRGVRIIVLKEEKYKSQIKEVLESLGLKLETKEMFKICTICNRLLEEVDKEKIKDRIPEYVYKTHTTFFICLQCNRIYWQGTHWNNVSRAIEEIKL